MVSNTQHTQEIMNRKKKRQKQKKRKTQRKWREEWERKRGVLQRGSHRPAVRCMAEAHHSANYDQAFPCRHSSAGNGKSLFSHTPMEAMGHGAMQMRCLYTRMHSYTDRHTHKHKQVCSVINTHCAYSHTQYPELRTHTNTIHTTVLSSRMLPAIYSIQSP